MWFNRKKPDRFVVVYRGPTNEIRLSVPLSKSTAQMYFDSFKDAHMLLEVIDRRKYSEIKR